MTKKITRKDGDAYVDFGEKAEAKAEENPSHGILQPG